MATLKEFEDALRAQGMTTALGILDGLRRRDRAKRSVAPARRVTGQRMTPDLARRILDLHGSTGLTQQEIAFRLGVNQGRVNEVVKRGKWLDGDAASAEAKARDKALARARSPRKPSLVLARRDKINPRPPAAPPAPTPGAAQLSFGDL